MENYPTLFLASSTVSSTMVNSNNNNTSSYSGLMFQGNNNNNNKGNNGFLGLMSEMEVPSGGGGLSIMNNNSNNNDMSMSKISGQNEEKYSGKKKGSEKKIKKPRYAFQTRSQVDILDDGYRWRKYGQKAVKNNKFPRSYYRCTHQGCNVKKQVQRLTKDEGVVVTTYEGMHSHPIEKSTDNFEHILSQMQIYTSY
uniref:WRKY transcription factor B n=1 Tax=Dimocarpus longan TaxID=128017 RepID=G3FFB8_9ROSI|nr:WRKY transcription factor B [Dimocarpus longan]